MEQVGGVDTYTVFAIGRVSCLYITLLRVGNPSIAMRKGERSESPKVAVRAGPDDYGSQIHGEKSQERRRRFRGHGLQHRPRTARDPTFGSVNFDAEG